MPSSNILQYRDCDRETALYIRYIFTRWKGETYHEVHVEYEVDTNVTEEKERRE
jgi:hypothetical protein